MTAWNGRFGGLDVIDDDSNDDGLKVLHRMITYVRQEALRLRIMDVALLLEHAEEAVVAFAPLVPADPAADASGRDGSTLEH